MAKAVGRRYWQRRSLVVGRRLLDIWRVLTSVQISGRKTRIVPMLNGLRWTRAPIGHESSGLRVESLALIAAR